MTKKTYLCTVCIMLLQEERRFAMCVIKEIGRSMMDGVHILRMASRGRYYIQTAEISKMREEVLGAPSSIVDDMRHLREDRQRINHDIRISFDKIVAEDV